MDEQKLKHSNHNFLTVDVQTDLDVIAYLLIKGYDLQQSKLVDTGATLKLTVYPQDRLALEQALIFSRNKKGIARKDKIKIGEIRALEKELRKEIKKASPLYMHLVDGVELYISDTMTDQEIENMIELI
jgi:hypothetical protein